MRNDPCPCGSGKKHKKCCLKKAAIVETAKIKEERFLQRKHDLVNKLNRYVNETLSFNEYNQLYFIFQKRTENKINKNFEKGFFQFWLFFFYKSEGKRIVEEFADHNKDKLPINEMELLNTWVSLKPQLVQAIQDTEETITFEDMFSKKTYKVARVKENAAHSLPWFGTVSLLEEFNKSFYFNGAKLFVEPLRLYEAKQKILTLVKEENMSEENVIMEYYPELLAILLDDSTKSFAEKKIEEVTAVYETENVENLIEQFHQNIHFVKSGTGGVKHFTWVADWHEYEDSQLEGKVHIAEVKATISIKDHVMEVTSFNQSFITKLATDLAATGIVLTKTDERVNSYSVRETVEIKNFSIHIPEDAKEYFALYAQAQYMLYENKSILMFDSLTPSALKDHGKLEQLETWLKQEEYQIHAQLAKHFGKVAVTPDFNTYRKMMGLPLSKYVTDNSSRTSTVTKLNFVNNEAVESLQVLGFTPYTAESFFAKDMLAFYEEKTEGKSKGTIRKYRNSLHDLREIFETTKCTSWDTMNLDFWKNVMTIEFYNLYEYVSPTGEKDFISVTKAFAKWVDEKHNTLNYKHIMNALK
ncbi:SEC-C domain-containing protein [Bacillus sp. FJAT-45066]|uniref:SEC-C domain-containing protein n=1 Tax=Bacillus sp. FJAT-45066 TaxID=2011010 RepID=UPI001C3F0585|nr:SEC-C domain-containing protein [Bacillus sp. FJAT-45066]